MEREANYAAVGAFVLLVAMVAALFVYWYSDTREHRDYQRYEIYFDGSVSGLDKGAAVRYLGVGVGRVVDMRIDPRDSARVEVIVDIDSTHAGLRATRSRAAAAGRDGPAVHRPAGGPRAASAPRCLVASLKYPVIRSAPSRFDVFLSGLPELVADAGEVVKRARPLLSDEQPERRSRALLANLEATSRRLPQTRART